MTLYRPMEPGRLLIGPDVAMDTPRMTRQRAVEIVQLSIPL